MNNSRLLEALCRRDFYAFCQKAFNEIDASHVFISNWHLELICDKLYQCAIGKLKRLIINIAPRSLKSHCVSVSFPAFLLGHNPNARIICVSYSQVIANDLSQKTRRLIETDFYESIFNTRIGDKNTESYFNTNGNGYRYSTSIDGTLTGFGGNFIIIDDPIKADEATSEAALEQVKKWYDNTLISRLNDKVNGCIILVMQRLHVDDLTAHLLKQEGWDLLSLPAIAEEDEQFTLSTGRVIGRKKGDALNPTLEPIEVLENHRKLMGEYNFSAQYQQNPIPTTGNILDIKDFQTYPPHEIRQTDAKFQSWDIALKDGKNNDYSVCVSATLSNNVLYIENIERFKLDMPNLMCKIRERFEQAGKIAHVIIEESPISCGLIQTLKSFGLHPIPAKPQGEKTVRANNASYYIHAGQVKLPTSAPWLDEFEAEIKSFPFGKHDDQVDALTQLINHVLGRKEPTLMDIAEAINRQKASSISAPATNQQMCKLAFQQYKRTLQLGRSKFPKWRF